MIDFTDNSLIMGDAHHTVCREIRYSHVTSVTHPTPRLASSLSEMETGRGFYGTSK